MGKLALAAAVSMAVLGALPALGSAPGGLSRWVETSGWLAGAENTSTVEQTITIVYRLRAADGTKAVQVLSFRKALPPSKTNVRCGGKLYRGRYVSDIKGAAGTGWFGIDDHRGTARLRIARALEVLPSPFAGPLCALFEGSWEGISGPLRGQSGKFSYVSPETARTAVQTFR